jgi:hypothetical protein
MKCTRRRCQVALKTLAIAALMPSSLSLITSLTPRRPRRLGLRVPDLQTEHLALAVGVDADRHYHGHADDATGLPRLHVGGVDPQVRPVASIGRFRKAPTRSSSSAHRRLTGRFQATIEAGRAGSRPKDVPTQ